MAYATLSELKTWVGIPTADTGDDTTLQLALDAAEVQVNQYVGRTSFTIDASAVARTFRPLSSSRVDIDPIATTTGLVVKTDDDDNGTFETTWTINTDFRLEPTNAAAMGVPWTRLVAIGTKRFPASAVNYEGVEVTAKYGWPTAVPAPVKAATLIVAAKIWKRKDAAFGIAGSAEFGSEMRILPGDMDAERLLAAYRRPWVFV